MVNQQDNDARYLRPQLPAMTKDNDYFTLTGASALATRITEYWSALGFVVRTRLERETTGAGSVYIVRSDMIGGQPRPPNYTPTKRRERIK